MQVRLFLKSIQTPRIEVNLSIEDKIQLTEVLKDNVSEKFMDDSPGETEMRKENYERSLSLAFCRERKEGARRLIALG